MSRICALDRSVPLMLPAIVGFLAASCSGRTTTNDGGDAAIRDVSGAGNGGSGQAGAGQGGDGQGGTAQGGTAGQGGQGGAAQGGTAGQGGQGGAGQGGAGSGGVSGGDSTDSGARDAQSDGDCASSCFQPGAQLCGRIGTNCGSIDCPACMEPGFTCGGGGIAGVCGAPRDGGICKKPLECKQPGGQYCGVIGGGCGDALDCGACPPPMTCGAAGTPNVCGISDNGDCIPSVCNPIGARYCGAIGNGCGKRLDCGDCPAGLVCGAIRPRFCGPPCPLCDQVVRCEGGKTTVSGVAVTGSKSNPHPLYGATVFIPNIAKGAKLPPLVSGPICASCLPLTSDDALAASGTGQDGRFVLTDVPAGTGIPLVVQLGKWRMQTTIDVIPCVDNGLPAGQVRFPRNRNEGDIPLTAIATGSDDKVECLLRKIGLDDSEFTNPDGGGRIHVYHATGATLDANTPDITVLKGGASDPGRFANYDQVLLPCQGAQHRETAEALAHFADYVNGGGRVLATHESYAWLFGNGSFANIGTWTAGAPDPAAPLTATFPLSITGTAFAPWLGAVGALSSTSPPQMQIASPHADLGALTMGKGGDAWLVSASPMTTQAAMIYAPASQCGRSAFSDFHAGGAPSKGTTFPAECGTDTTLSAEEKALEFLLLNLFTCVGPNKGFPPTPDPLPPPPDQPPPPPTRPPPPTMSSSVRYR